MDADAGVPLKLGQQCSVKRVLMSRLIDAVKQCQTTFGATKAIASEPNTNISYLLSQLEAVLYHGLKRSPSVFSTIRDMAERVAAIKLDNFLVTGSPGDAMWACLRTLLSESEVHRLYTLKNVATDAGRARSWLRGVLNERSIRRYLDQLVGDKQLLALFYEEHAFLRDHEATAIFPQVCAGLDTILFSLDVDNVELDLQSHILDDETFEALLEAKKAPQPIMAVASDSRNRLDSAGSANSAAVGGPVRKRRPLVNVVSFDNEKKLSGTEGQMRVLTGGYGSSGTAGKGKLMGRSASESGKKVLASSVTVEDLACAMESTRPSSVDATGSVGSVPESVFSAVHSPSPFYMLESGIITRAENVKGLKVSRSVLSEDTQSEATTRSRRSSLAEDDRHQNEEVATQSRMLENNNPLEMGSGCLKGRLAKYQDTIAQLKYDLQTLRDEHLQFVRHQSARLDLVMKEQETVRDLWRKKITKPSPQAANEQTSGNGDAGSSDHVYEGKLIQLTQMHGELLELNESLQRQLLSKNSLMRRMKDELLALRGPLPEDFATEVNAGSCSHHVNLWVPTAFLTGKGSDVHHVYQVYVRLKYSEWNVYRRYADFNRMHKELTKRDSSINQFRLPPKRKFGHKEKAFVEERKKQLESYLRLLVNHVVRHFPEFQAVSVNKETLGQLIPFFQE